MFSSKSSSMDEMKSNDVALVQSIASVPKIMRVIADSTGLRFVCVARVTEHSWTSCALLDRLGFGLVPGDELLLSSTLCDTVRKQQESIIIDCVSVSADYQDHATPRQYGFESYFSVPLYWQDGQFFGTLCGLDPEPNALSAQKIRDSLHLYAELISLQLETEKRVILGEQALTAERETAELREQFIAVLGHDLRTPLSSMMNGAELIKFISPGDKASAIAERIVRSGKRIAHLVDDLMDFARGRLGGGIPLAMTNTADLGAQLRHAVAELESSHPGSIIRCKIELPFQLLCDADRLTQLLSNLLVNALTHGDRQQVIDVEAYCRDGALFITVSNHGAAIAPAILERLFQPFWRGDKATPVAAGLGLGLYIASQIAISHHGELSVESTPAHTVFTFRMEIGV
ncbi:MAG: hypothetical protein RLZZ237_3136 [Pseudomonadota bacterium]|jgi:signal transduction histidine kinase